MYLCRWTFKTISYKIILWLTCPPLLCFRVNFHSISYEKGHHIVEYSYERVISTHSVGNYCLFINADAVHNIYIIIMSYVWILSHKCTINEVITFWTA